MTHRVLPPHCAYTVSVVITELYRFDNTDMAIPAGEVLNEKLEWIVEQRNHDDETTHGHIAALTFDGSHFDACVRNSGAWCVWENDGVIDAEGL